MKILIINGPNLNMLGIREPEIYGNKNYAYLVNMIREYSNAKNIEVEIYQSNHEGDLIDKIQDAYFKKVDGIIINPGAYTHTSIALLDALKAVSIKTIEVHISEVKAREEFRKISYVSLAAYKVITGEGFEGYLHAIDILLEEKENETKTI